MEFLNSLRETMATLRKREPLVDPVEKRRIYRVRCSLPAVVVLNKKEAISGRLVNLSTRGMKLHLERRLKTGDIYRVFLRSRTSWQDHEARQEARELSLRATALWCKRSPTVNTGYDIGFLFFSFSGMRSADVIDFFREQLQVPVAAAGQKRRMTRIRRNFEIEMTHPEAVSLTGSVRDLSLDGVQWAADLPLEEASIVHLTIHLDDLGKLHCQAQVKWCRLDSHGDIGFEIGARFLGMTSVDKSRLVQIVNRHLKDHWGTG